MDEEFEAYIRAGLDEIFAQALVDGVDSKHVMDLWEMEWWKQYEPTDELFTATLSGKITCEDGRWMNDIRSDHQNLVEQILDGRVTMEWARAVMATGFKDDSEAVEMLLDGALPSVITRLRGISDGNEIAKLDPNGIGWIEAYDVPGEIKEGTVVKFKSKKQMERLVQFESDIYGSNVEKAMLGPERAGDVWGDDRSSDKSIKVRLSDDNEFWVDARFLLVKESSL